MKRSIHFLEYLYCHLLIVFLIGRVGFILNNRSIHQLSFFEAAGACWRGFVEHDLGVAACLLAIPWLAGLLIVFRSRQTSSGGEARLRAWLTPYYILMGLAVSVIIVADAVTKGLCVENWDSNGDGELSQQEDAAVTILNGVFRNNYDITYDR